MASRQSNIRLRFILLFPFAGYFVFAYPVSRLTGWYDSDIEITVFHSLAIWLLGLAGMYYSFSGPKMIIRYLVVHWLGVSFVFAVLTLTAEPVRMLTDLDDRLIVQSVIVIGVVLVLFSVLVSHHLSIKRLWIRSPKISRKYRIAQISDVHIGSRQSGFMQRIVNRLNTLEPDFVVVTGDLIDSSSVDYEALESIDQIKAMTFFTIGNHERYADLDKILDIAKRLGMYTLRQDSHSAGELLFIGIDDADRRDQVDIHLPQIANNPDQFSLLLYHRPHGWEAAIDHGIDLMLCGHTHSGQIFPFNLIVKQQFNHINGLHRNRHHHLYVSPGTGTWGPLMRLGSLNEITLFELVPE